MNFVISLVLWIVFGITSAAAAPQASSSPPQSGRTTKSRTTAARRSKAAKRPSKKTAKRAPKAKPRLTPADASGIRDARPGSLKAMALAVLEKNSLAEQQSLEAFAKRHSSDTNGVLAHLVLGYHAYQKKHYSEAKLNFEAARLVASSVQDYCEYYLALTNLAQGEHDAAIKNLDGFAARHPGSSLVAPATLREAEALISSDRAEEAIPLLASPAVALPPTVTDLLLGEAYRKEHQPEKAVPLLQKVYYLNPTSPQASSAEKHLKELRLEMGASYPNPSNEMREERADRLFAAGQWSDAESEYRAAGALASSAERDHARVRAGVCQYRMGDNRGALATLRNLEVEDAEADAERLYTLAALYRHLEQPDVMEQQLELLGRMHPASSWYEKGLFLAGNQYLVSQDPGRAAQYYTMAYQKFPHGDLAAESHWRVAWRRYRERNLVEARRLFQEHIQNYSSSPQLSAAIYWTGRTLEPESPADAALYYQKLVNTFPNYYYGLMARQRLAGLSRGAAARDGAAGTPDAAAALLDPIRRPVPDSALDPANLPASIQNRRTKAILLESAWLLDFAIEELKSGVGKDYSSNFFLGRELAHLEEARSRYNVALEYAKRLLNGYFAFDIADLPREDWELLFPLPWWVHIRQKAEALELDPYLVAGLIRQESEFNPDARSRSNALGLMQLLPTTAKRMAKRMSTGRARSFRLASLTTPEYNVAYGTLYLRQLLNQFNGSLEQTLAGYNAGENRVIQWLQEGNFEEPAEFVESIPFTETREYVQAVMRNAALYRKLYADERRSAKSDGLSRETMSAVSANQATKDGE